MALVALPGQTQLAKNFYYINRIESRVLPNAVQIIIRADGVVQFGVDLSEAFPLDANGRNQPQAASKIRLRFLKARSKLPSFNEIGNYPVDGAYISPGRDDLKSPYLSGTPNLSDPATDVELRFYVPVTLRQFNPFGSSGDIGTNDEGNEGGYVFTDVLGALDVGIELGRDRRSVIITIISDRVDALQSASLHRAPSKRKSRLNVKPTENGQFRFDVLHTPLRRVLDEVSRATNTPLLTRTDSAETDISLLLPSATPREFLDTLITGYGLSVVPQAPSAGGGYEVGRSGDLDISRLIPLNHMAPGSMRLLFPDFLLPRLRVNEENNALLAIGSPALTERIARDVGRLDLPRPQLRIEASAWEVSAGRSFDLVLSAALNRGDSHRGGSLDFNAGQAAFVIDEAQANLVSTTLTALQIKRDARLVATPFVVAASGERGSLFSGQNRFITVLRRRRGQQNAEAVKIQIGFSLDVTPRASGTDKDADILLELNPQISSVDEIEAGTGLPTIALRSVENTVRVRPGDTVILAGLDSQSEAAIRRGLFSPALSPTRRNIKALSALIFLVKVERL